MPLGALRKSKFPSQPHEVLDRHEPQPTVVKEYGSYPFPTLPEPSLNPRSPLNTSNPLNNLQPDSARKLDTACHPRVRKTIMPTQQPQPINPISQLLTLLPQLEIFRAPSATPHARIPQGPARPWSLPIGAPEFGDWLLLTAQKELTLFPSVSQIRQALRSLAADRKSVV